MACDIMACYCESSLFRWVYIYAILAEMKNPRNFYMLKYGKYPREFADFHSSAKVLTRENNYFHSI